MTVRVVGSVSSPNEGIAAYSVLTARCRARPFRRRNADAKLLRPWQPKLRVAERIPATVARMRNVTSGHSTSRKSRLVSKRSGYWRRADVLTTNSCQPSALSVNHVNLIFDPVRLARSWAVAPRTAFFRQEGPANPSARPKQRHAPTSAFTPEASSFVSSSKCSFVPIVLQNYFARPSV